MQCFKINKSNIQKRLDVDYNLPIYQKELDLLNKSKFKLRELRELCIKITDGTHYTPNYVEEGVKFVSVKDIKENQIDFENTKYITTEEHKELIKRCNPEHGDILLTKVGTIGNACVIPETAPEFSIFVSVALLKPNKTIINPYYLQICLSSEFAKMQMKRELKGIGVPDLHLENIAKIKIPVPENLCEQENIVKKMQEAYKNKSNKEIEAETIINSFENEIYSKLDVCTPEFKFKQCYKISANNIKKKRIDAFYYQPDFEDIALSIKKSKYKVIPLIDIIDTVISGQRPQGGVSQIKEGVPSLGGEHVLANGLIEPEKLKYIPIDFHHKHITSRAFPLDIILVKDGATTGKVGIIPESYPHKEININEHVFILRVKKEVNPYYVFAYLKTQMAQIQIKREVVGGTIMGIVKDSLNNILIPYEDKNFNIQNEIAQEYKKRLEQYMILKNDAIQNFYDAKNLVEKMILGEE